MHTQHFPAAPLPLSVRLRERWAAGIPCSSDVAFAFGVSFIWLALYNVHFWQLSADGDVAPERRLGVLHGVAVRTRLGRAGTTAAVVA